MKEISEPLRLTVKMLKSAYPDGIPDSDYFAVLYVLSEKGGMGDEPIAEVIAALKGKTYLRYHYDVAHALPNKRIKNHVIDAVIDKLMPHGYADWLKEED